MMFDLLSLASIIAKFFLYISVLTAAGTAIVAPLFRLSLKKIFTAKAILIALCSSLMLYGLDAILLAGDITGLVNVEILSLISETSNGNAFYIRIIGLVLLLMGLLNNRLSKWISIIGSFISLYSFTQVGHMHEHGSVLISLSLFVHVTVAALWLSILLPLRDLVLSENTVNEAAKVAHQFGQIALFFIPLLILAGTYMAWVLFDNTIDLVSTRYGQIILIKIFLTSILLSLAAFNKFKFVPQLKAGSSLAAHKLANTIQIERVLLTLILIAIAIATSVAKRL